ncbi:LacI family DNA-binding transcriptional regulator [Mesorhizobium koreense]|uniref:LacI family DNA-binding transcriptional regulator n=1 Tax=Mesorhizobium koreense TaxID=3074855 RepID=UPI00287BC639|nr:LacI family DNA-binding transcriptional regulator [Mesorhizobium sp. WR6]
MRAPPDSRRRSAGGRRRNYTLADVAERAGVSEITVSRVLRDKGPISLKTRERVMTAVAHLGYMPNRIAGTLASAGSNLIGVVLSSLTNNVFADVLGGIHSVLAPAGYQPVVSVTDYDEAEEERIVASLLAWQPAAMIVSGVNHTAATRLMLARAHGRVAEIMDIDSAPLDLGVGFSHRAAGYDTARHLCARGYRRFGYVGLDRARDPRAALRYEGMMRGLSEAGLSLFAEAAAEFPTSTQGGRRLLAELLEREPALDVVVFSNDDMAVGGFFHCLAAGIRPREDLALFGFNALEIGQSLPMPLSTIRSRRDTIGRIAATHILETPLRPPEPTIIDTGYEIVEGATA